MGHPVRPRAGTRRHPAGATPPGTTGGHSIRLINPRFAREARFFWDERAPTLEHQSTQPIRDPVEMGFSGTAGDPDFAALTAKLAAIPESRVLAAMASGDAAVTEARVQRSLAQFLRSIQSFDSKYDAVPAIVADDQDFANFTAQEYQGKRQFLLTVAQGRSRLCELPHAAHLRHRSGQPEQWRHRATRQRPGPHQHAHAQPARPHPNRRSGCSTALFSTCPRLEPRDAE